MGLGSDLTADEIRALRDALGSLGRDSDREITLDGLLNRWSLLVASVERGYDDTIYDYLNELAVREHLQMLLDCSSSSLRAKLDDLIGPWDRRFFEATTPTRRPLIARQTSEFWWNRVPTRLRGELKADLEASGLV